MTVCDKLRMVLSLLVIALIVSACVGMTYLEARGRVVGACYARERDVLRCIP